jgi:hypothetical protein
MWDKGKGIKRLLNTSNVQGAHWPLEYKLYEGVEAHRHRVQPEVEFLGPLCRYV